MPPARYGPESHDDGIAHASSLCLLSNFQKVFIFATIILQKIKTSPHMTAKPYARTFHKLLSEIVLVVIKVSKHRSNRTPDRRPIGREELRRWQRLRNS